MQILYATRRRRPGGWHDCAIQAIDVEGDVHRLPAQWLYDLLDVPARLVLAPVHVDAVAVGFEKLDFARGDRANAGRHQGHMLVVEHAAHGGCMRIVFAKVAVAQICMRIEL